MSPLAEVAEVGKTFYGVSLVPICGALIAIIWKLGPRFIAAIVGLTVAITKAGGDIRTTADDAKGAHQTSIRIEGGVERIEAGIARVEAEVVELRIQLAMVTGNAESERKQSQHD